MKKCKQPHVCMRSYSLKSSRFIPAFEFYQNSTFGIYLKNNVDGNDRNPSLGHESVADAQSYYFFLNKQEIIASFFSIMRAACIQATKLA